MAVPCLGSEFDLRTLIPVAFEGLVAGLHLRDDIDSEIEVVPEIRIDRWSSEERQLGPDTLQYQSIPLAVRVDGSVLAYVQPPQTKSKDTKKTTTRKRSLPSTSQPSAPVEQTLTSSPTPLATRHGHPLATARARTSQTSPKAKRRRKDSNLVPSPKATVSQNPSNTWGFQPGALPSGQLPVGPSGMVQFGHLGMGQSGPPSGVAQSGPPSGVAQSGPPLGIAQSGPPSGIGQSGPPSGIGQLGPSSMYNMSVPVQYQPYYVQLPQGIPSGIPNYSHPAYIYNGSSHVPSHYVQSPATPYVQYAIPPQPAPPPPSVPHPTPQHGPHSHHTFWP